MGIAAQAVGIMQACLDLVLSYSKERKQFGQPISNFQMIQAMIVDMATDLEAARLLLYRSAALRDAKKPFTKEVSMAKLFASEAAVKAANDTVQILGGYGYSKEYPAERYYRDAKITTIYEGTSEVQRIVISRSLLKG
jgi:alkylation response protein AidB-like acyl-CoA dehydrogenase